jgi:hypothetical protein
MGTAVQSGVTYSCYVKSVAVPAQFKYYDPAWLNGSPSPGTSLGQQKFIE